MDYFLGLALFLFLKYCTGLLLSWEGIYWTPEQFPYNYVEYVQNFLFLIWPKFKLICFVKFGIHSLFLQFLISCGLFNLLRVNRIFHAEITVAYQKIWNNEFFQKKADTLLRKFTRHLNSLLCIFCFPSSFV